MPTRSVPILLILLTTAVSARANDILLVWQYGDLQNVGAAAGANLTADIHLTVSDLDVQFIQFSIRWDGDLGDELDYLGSTSAGHQPGGLNWMDHSDLTNGNTGGNPGVQSSWAFSGHPSSMDPGTAVVGTMLFHVTGNVATDGIDVDPGFFHAHDGCSSTTGDCSGPFEMAGAGVDEAVPLPPASLVAATDDHLLTIDVSDPSQVQVIGPLDLMPNRRVIDLAYHPGVQRLFGIVWSLSPSPVEAFFVEFDLATGEALEEHETSLGLLQNVGSHESLAYVDSLGSLVLSRSEPSGGSNASSQFVKIDADGVIGDVLFDTNRDNDRSAYDANSDDLYVLDSNDSGRLSRIDLQTGQVLDRGRTADAYAPEWSEAHDLIYAIDETTGQRLLRMEPHPFSMADLGPISLPSSQVRALPEPDPRAVLLLGACVLCALASRPRRAASGGR